MFNKRDLSEKLNVSYATICNWLKTNNIEHNDEIAPTDQSPNKEQNSTVIKNPTDDYSALKDLLKQLKEQRDALNKKINDLEKKIQ